MNRIALAAVLSVLTAAAPAAANIISIGMAPPRMVTAAEAADGAPAGGTVFQFLVSTDGDILSVSQVQVTLAPGVTLYNNPFGDAANAEPGQPALIPVFPAVGVDSWITTPGSTSQLGPGLPGDGDLTTFGDLTNDGPQNNFVFAQLTAPSDTFRSFKGVIAIAGDGNQVYTQDFFIVAPVPEPTAISLTLVGFASLLHIRHKRSTVASQS